MEAVTGVVLVYFAFVIVVSWRDVLHPPPKSCITVALARVLVVFLLWHCFGVDVQRRRGGFAAGLLFFGASACMLLGFFSRVSTAVTGACALYFHGASNLANVDPHRVQQYLGHAEEVLGAPALDFKNFTEKFLIKYEPWGPHHHVTALTFLTCLLALTPCGGAISFDL